MENVIEVKNLVKRYSKAKQNAVDNISLSVSEGEFFAFLGPNGAGKTTTISILTTLLSKTSGEVSIAGHDIEKDAALVRQRIGIIFQYPSLDLNLTAEENVRLHAFLYNVYPYRPTYNMMPDTYKRKVHSLAELLGITDEIFNPIKTFSGGMKRKLEIIRSLIHNPKVLFLDEPTSGLDPTSRRSLWSYLEEVRKTEKITIFLTTHYLEEAEKCNNIAIINHGKIISQGSPEQIKSQLAKNLLIVDSEDRAGLAKELDHLKVSYLIKDGFEIDVRSEDVHKLISSINTHLISIKTQQPTLEEAYLALIEEPSVKEDINAET